MRNKRTFGYIEVGFDVVYLLTMLVLGIVLLIGKPDTIRLLFGLMAMACFLGDSFHLLPRILSAVKQDRVYSEDLLGFGKMNASITMTLFYVLLWHAGLLLFSISIPIMTWTVYGLAAVRIILCVLPQNKWAGDNAPMTWNILRNFPFFILGAMVGILFFMHRNVGFTWMWLAVTLSFACYLPVVLWAKKYPPLGMLMLPKSCMYVWIVAMAVTIL